MTKTRIIVIDDSALIRKLLTKILSSDPTLEVVASARDPLDAREKIKALDPDVLTLDVEMPEMDGLTFLNNLMRLRPMPVVMVSSLTEDNADVTLDALELGAIDYVTKPKVDVAGTLEDYGAEIIAKVKSAAGAKGQLRTVQRSTARPRVAGSFKTTDRLIAVGASTGGTEAIRSLLEVFPADSPGVLVTQHIPPLFSARFAERLNNCCALTVVEARDGQPVIPGHAFVAPGDKHLKLLRDGAHYRCRLSNEPPRNGHTPSVDVLFDSVAKNAGNAAVGVLLTGMGKDGSEGLLAMREAGALTVAQDEKTSIVWGMPGEAVKIGAAQEVLPLDTIAATTLEACR